METRPQKKAYVLTFVKDMVTLCSLARLARLALNAQGSAYICSLSTSIEGGCHQTA